MNEDNHLRESAISDLALKWRLCCENHDMEYTEGYGTSWSFKRYIIQGTDCAYVVAEENLFGQPGQGWTKNDYEYWYIDKRVTRKGVRIDHDRYSPVANWCKDERYWVEADSPEDALDNLLMERFERDEFIKNNEENYS